MTVTDPTFGLEFFVQENGKLCILRLSAIGDVCHAVAMVERIQRMRPDIEITWIIGKVEYQLVQDMPGIRFVVFDKRQGWSAYQQLRRDLKGTRFDVLLLMQVALRANLASLMIRAKKKIGFDAERAKELHHFFITHRIANQKHPHVLDGFMAFADAAGIADGGIPRWHIPIPDEAGRSAQALLNGMQRYAVICPSASKAERNWTVAGYQEIACHLKSRGYAVILCGGPAGSEKALAEAIEVCGDIQLNLTGKTSLKQLLAILKGAELVIAPDTGPAHMATTVSTPVVGLYAHSNPVRTGPYNDIEHVVSVYETVIQQQKGKSWRELRWGARAKGQDLMALIKPEQVIAQIDRVPGTPDNRL
ncbi:glycosyltransferase family 9 protein [Planctobacterium marinum]|uniref:glycosyltransferase family 9 protein n=1 Tax=Planctobacterium marinum TaxID=1631968 RepID=UPI001E331ABF|nr:glycosyltransferase family 9 protein [Planctobacterium marinum]MCC2606433.1 glycosyltransferase family 9 protein [Planctobacterium marinum]